MAQTLIKVDYKGEKCNGVYYVDSDILDDIITKENAPKRTLHKFVLRQTVTIEGIGKKTAKETIVKSGISFYKALQAVIAEREPMRDRIKDKLLGVTDSTAEDNALAVLTIDELWEQYSEYKKKFATKKKWSQNYAYTMASDYKRLVQPYIGKVRALQVKREDVENCIQKSRDRGLKARSDYAIVTVVKPMFDWWIDRKELDKRNPARRLDLRELDNEVDVDLSWDQIEKLYRVMYTYKDERYRQVFIWLSTGRRNGEVLSLRHEHLDGNYFTVVAENNKSKKDMIYRIPDNVTLPLYKGYIHTAPRDRDKQIQPATLNNLAWNNVRYLSELPSIRKHDLRHILTTALKNGAVPLEIRSMVLGHTMSDITERYATDTKEGADLKYKAVSYFLDKVFNRIDRKMMWNEYIIKNS